jgi:hypothetical protein
VSHEIAGQVCKPNEEEETDEHPPLSRVGVEQASVGRQATWTRTKNLAATRMKSTSETGNQKKIVSGQYKTGVSYHLR